jgi:hypothetical protein
MVRLEGLRVGSLGDRNGDTGAEVEEVLLFLVVSPNGTLRLRFLALRARLGGDDDLLVLGCG